MAVLIRIQPLIDARDKLAEEMADVVADVLNVKFLKKTS